MAGEVEAAAAILKTLFGEKQLGGIAPGFNPGGGAGFDALGLNEGIFGEQGAVQQLGGLGGLFGNQSIESLIGKPEERGQELAPQVLAQDQQGSPAFVNPPQDTSGFVDPALQDESVLLAKGPFGLQNESEEELGLFSKFFGNLDQNLQSPSKVIGLGLLNQLDPRLAGLGLFGGGLFGKNKLF